jgi:hypothetical protein
VKTSNFTKLQGSVKTVVFWIVTLCSFVQISHRTMVLPFAGLKCASPGSDLIIQLMCVWTLPTALFYKLATKLQVGVSSLDCAQLSRLHMKTGTDPALEVSFQIENKLSRNNNA